MDKPLDNANPTILNANQLPSRRHNKSATKPGPESRYDDILLPKHSDLWGPSSRDVSSWPSDDENEDMEAPIDEQEIYDLISTISDPEHPHTLGQLAVVNLPDIHISPSPSAGFHDPDALTQVLVECTPTINHCSLATVIGLAVRVRLEQTLPPNYRVDVRMKDGSHAQDDQVNKQLADKERVAAALENDTLRGVLDKMLETCQQAW